MTPHKMIQPVERRSTLRHVLCHSSAVPAPDASWVWLYVRCPECLRLGDERRAQIRANRARARAALALTRVQE